MAQALFGNPDILLFDEPTNNLDINTISWLENFLADYQNIVLVVAMIVTFWMRFVRMLRMLISKKLRYIPVTILSGMKAAQLAARQATDKNKKQEEKKKDLLEFIARFSANASKSKQATSRKKALDKLVFEDITPSNRKYPGIIFKPERELGNQILNVQKLTKSVEGKVLFSNVNFDVVKGQKIAFLSKDPVALTSFFEIINNRMKADSGQFEWGTTITTAYLPNDNSNTLRGSCHYGLAKAVCARAFYRCR